MDIFKTQSLFLLLAGCAGDPKESDTAAETDTETAAETDTETDTETDSDNEVDLAVFQTTVDATSYDDWVYLDLDTRTVVTPSTPEDSLEWDLAFQRQNIALNGGESGTGGVHVAAFSGYYDQFDTNTQASPHGWVTDTEDADGDGNPEFALGGWYDYDPMTHTLSPADMLYFVQTVEGDYFRLRFTGYYDSSETGGFVGFESGQIMGY